MLIVYHITPQMICFVMYRSDFKISRKYSKTFWFQENFGSTCAISVRKLRKQSLFNYKRSFCRTLLFTLLFSIFSIFSILFPHSSIFINQLLFIRFNLIRSLLPMRNCCVSFVIHFIVVFNSVGFNYLATKSCSF